MRTSQMIKSKFWRARDVEGQPPVVLSISDVTEELLGRGARQDVKCFLWFNESPKGLQLNKTRVATLEAAYGPDSDLWVGKRVRISFDPTVEFGGRAVGGVRLQTPPGIVYKPTELHTGWGEGPQPHQLHPPGSPGYRPPPPVWDEKRQMWITPQPPAAAQLKRPPPPVWNETTQQWETVDTSTGEMAPPKHVPPPTISERVNAGNPPPTDGGWGALPPPAAAPDFDDDMPF
jgi:hypothetical protein